MPDTTDPTPAVAGDVPSGDQAAGAAGRQHVERRSGMVERRASTSRCCVCPGSYDPVTNGHLDVIIRAARLFDEVRVAVLVNPSKQGMFSLDDRVEMLREATSDVGNVTVESFDGLLVDYCRARAVDVIVKGVRAPSDVESELAMAQMNHRLSGVETVLIPTSPQWSFVASSLVKQVATGGGDVSGLVPDGVAARIARRRRS